MVLVAPPPDWQEEPPPLPEEQAAAGAWKHPVAATTHGAVATPVSDQTVASASKKSGVRLVAKLAPAAAAIPAAPTKMVPTVARLSTKASPAAQPAAVIRPGGIADAAGPRWFWPTFVTATALSLAAAGLILYMNQRGGLQPAVVQQESHGQAVAVVPTPQEKAPAPANVAAQVTKNEATVEKADAAQVVGEQKKIAADRASGGAVEQGADAPRSPAVAEKPVAPPPIAIEIAPATAPVAADPPREIRPTLERIAPRQIDVAARLTDPLAAISYHNTPLWRVLADLSQLGSVPITLDLDTLAEMSLSADEPVSVDVKGTTIGGALDELLAPMGLIAITVDHQLLVSRPKQTELRRVRYNVADLVPGADGEPARFDALIHDLVDAKSWKEKGGSGASRWTDSALVVEQTESAHAQMLELCEKLRVARGLPLRSKLNPARFRLQPRTAGAEAAIGQPLTANFARSEPLSRIVDHLRRAGNVTLLIDGVSLVEQRLSVDTEAVLVIERQSLGQCLTSLLESLELTWRVVGPRTIEITTPEAAARRTELEFYSARSLAPSGDGAAIVSQLQRDLQLPPDVAAATVIRFDSASRYLIVRAPQSAHIRLQAVLSAWPVAKQ